MDQTNEATDRFLNARMKHMIEEDFFKYVFLQTFVTFNKEEQTALLDDYIESQRLDDSPLSFNKKLDISNVICEFKDKMMMVIDGK